MFLPRLKRTRPKRYSLQKPPNNRRSVHACQVWILYPWLVSTRKSQNRLRFQLLQIQQKTSPSFLVSCVCWFFSKSCKTAQIFYWNVESTHISSCMAEACVSGGVQDTTCANVVNWWYHTHHTQCFWEVFFLQISKNARRAYGVRFTIFMLCYKF